MSKSLAQILAELPEDEQAEALDGVDLEAMRWDWNVWGRPEQFAPEGGWNVFLIVAGRGSGKLNSLSTKIPTPTGWTTMGELSIGSEVFDESGRICRVTGVFDSMPEKAYRVKFSDGTWIDAGGEHQWVTWTYAERRAFLRSPYEETTRRFPAEWPEWRLQRRPSGRGLPRVEVDSPGPQIRTTQQIVDTLTYGKRGDRNHCIPTAGALVLPEQDLIVDPWVLGMWLGDGCSAHGGVASDPSDQPEMRAQVERAGYATTVRKDPVMFGVLGLMTDLRKLGVLNNKHVPDVYLRSSNEQRLALLQGLMDSDGYAGHAGTSNVEFCNTNPLLISAVVELARSLGQKPVTVEGRSLLYGRDCGPKWRVFWTPTIQVFRLKRKAEKVARRLGGAQSLRNHHRMVVSCEPIPLVPMRCITVDSRHSMYLAGEGMIPTHNTRAGAEWIRKTALENPGCRIALVGRTSSDVTSVMVNGESGIMSVSPPSEEPTHKPSHRQLVWPNGSQATTFSAEEPDQLRGPQFHYAWADEAAAWKFVKDQSGLNAWDNLRLATRLGDVPRILATTTPKRTPFMQDLLLEAERKPGQVALSRGSTYDNAGNLSEAYLDVITGVYEGTRLAQQELLGLMIEAFEGALFTEASIDAARVSTVDVSSLIKVVAVDPSVAQEPNDECGIVVVGATRHRKLHQRHGYVLDDVSVMGSPEVWARAVVETARKWNAPVVAEGNQGHALITMAIHSIDPTVPVLIVHSKVGKMLRAEPVALVYEQGRVHHVDRLALLEAQMTNWVPADRKSPDRLDAVVHGLTALLIKPPTGLDSRPLRAHSLSGRRLPTGRGMGSGHSGMLRRRKG